MLPREFLGQVWVICFFFCRFIIFKDEKEVGANKNNQKNAEYIMLHGKWRWKLAKKRFPRRILHGFTFHSTNALHVEIACSHYPWGFVASEKAVLVLECFRLKTILKYLNLLNT